MKIEQLLVQYLYNNKNVSLQDIGVFHISPDIILPVDNDKEMQLPPDAILFEYDKKAILDEGLVNFIVQQTRKIRPLASSDLESYSILSKQFLNIGKPLIIDGLGTLQKSQQGNYVFTQGHIVNAKLEAGPVQVKEKQSEEISFKSTEKRSDENPKKTWAVAALIGFIILIAAATIYFLFYKTKDSGLAAVDEPTVDSIVMPVTTTPIAVITDTLTPVKDSTNKVTPETEGSVFRVVIKEYPSKALAEKAYLRLTNFGHKLLLSPIDSLRYKLSIPFNSPLSDTTRAKDSLTKFFQSKTYIEL